METEKTVTKNYFFNLIQQACLLLSPLITVPYVSRVLGVQSIGICSYVTASVTYFTLIANLGSSTYGQKHIAIYANDAQKRTAMFYSVLCFRAITAFCALIGFFLYIQYAAGAEYKALMMVESAAIVSVFFDITWFFQGLQNFKVTALRSVFFKIIGTALTFVFVKKPEDAAMYLAFDVGSTLLGNLSLFKKLKMYLTPIQRKEIRPFSCLKESLQFFIPGIAVQIYTVLDKTMLWRYAGGGLENGYYEQAMKIIRFSVSILSAYSTAFFPRMVEVFHHATEEEARDKIQKGAQIVTFLGLPITWGIALTAPTLVPVFLGEGYEQSIALLQILAPEVFVIGISTALGQQYYNAAGKQNLSTAFVTCGALLNIGLNLCLMPRLFSVGAAIASCLTETVITILFVAFARRYFSMKQFLLGGVRHMAASCLMALVVWAIPGGGISFLLLKVGAGALTYGLSLCVFRDPYLLQILSGLKQRGERKRR